MFCRGVGTDTEVSEEEVYMADEWPKRILFLTVPLRGHVTHTVRLAEWFLRKPEKYQIHVGVPSEGAGLLPKGVTTHEPQDGEPNPGAEEVDKPFVLAAHAKNWEDSMAAMIVNADLDYITGLTLFGIRVLREVQPHVVVCDHTYAGANYLHTACRSEEVPLIVITSMGRPESMNNMASILKIIPPLLGRTSAALGLIGPLINLQSSLKGEVGSTLPESDQPNIILPSCRLFFEEEPPDHLLFTGPFLPLPTKGKDTTALADSPDLLQWLRSAIDPVVFVALGTLVQPSQELLGRLVEGLESDRWRVLWALPESHQLLLPQRSFSSRWRIDKFVPQLAVLSSGYISCFISHCGANSTLESMSNGVPMVCMPFFCDQYEWADTVCELKQAGVWIDKNDADAEEIHGALEAVLDDPTYKRNAEIVAEEMLEEAQAKLRLAGLQSGAGPLTADKRSGAGVPVAAMVIEATLKGEDPRMLFKAPPTAPVRRLKKQGCC